MEHDHKWLIRAAAERPAFKYSVARDPKFGDLIGSLLISLSKSSACQLSMCYFALTKHVWPSLREHGYLSVHVLGNTLTNIRFRRTVYDLWFKMVRVSSSSSMYNIIGHLVCSLSPCRWKRDRNVDQVVNDSWVEDRFIPARPGTQLMNTDLGWWADAQERTHPFKL